jgi:hypothetical protein
MLKMGVYLAFQHTKEGSIMSENGYGSVNPNELATLSLLTNGRRGGIGLGGDGIGEELLAAKAVANGTAENAKLDKLQDDIATHAGQTRDLLRDRQFNDMQLNVQDIRTELVRQAGDNRVELQSEVGKVQEKLCNIEKDLLKCCCETQKEVIAQGSLTRDLSNRLALEESQRETERSERERNTQAIIAAINENGHRHYGRGLTAAV